MKKLLSLSLICFLSVASLGLAFREASPKLIINFKNVESSEGEIVVSLCNSEEQFPNKPYKAYYFSKETLSGSTLKGSISKIEPGDYVIAVLDDENKKDKMDYTFGIPKEGYGFSNDAKPRGFSPPRFDDCKFTVKPSGTTEITIHMNYF